MQSNQINTPRGFQNMAPNTAKIFRCIRGSYVSLSCRYSGYDPRAVGIREFSELSGKPPKITLFDSLQHHHHTVENSGSKVSIERLEVIFTCSFRIHSWCMVAEIMLKKCEFPRIYPPYISKVPILTTILKTCKKSIFLAIISRTMHSTLFLMVRVESPW